MVLVDGVVGQVLEEIRQVVFVWGLELVSGKPGKSIAVEEHPERLHASDECIYSEIELELIDQQGIGNVTLDDERAGFIDFGRIAEEEYSTALAAVFWFRDIELSLAVFLHHEVVVHREDEGLGVEVVLLGEVALHGVEGRCEFVLAGQAGDIGEVVDLNVWRQFSYFLEGECLIGPEEGIEFDSLLEVEFGGGFLDNGILGG